MIRKILSLGADRLVSNENAPSAPSQRARYRRPTCARSATGAALAVSVDTSPAVLISMWDYAHRVARPRERRRRA